MNWFREVQDLLFQNDKTSHHWVNTMKEALIIIGSPVCCLTFQWPINNPDLDHHEQMSTMKNKIDKKTKDKTEKQQQTDINRSWKVNQSRATIHPDNIVVIYSTHFMLCWYWVDNAWKDTMTSFRICVTVFRLQNGRSNRFWIHFSDNKVLSRRSYCVRGGCR
jgi:hypothetical protein